MIDSEWVMGRGGGERRAIRFGDGVETCRTCPNSGRGEGPTFKRPMRSSTAERNFLSISRLLCQDKLSRPLVPTDSGGRSKRTSPLWSPKRLPRTVLAWGGTKGISYPSHTNAVLCFVNGVSFQSSVFRIFSKCFPDDMDNLTHRRTTSCAPGVSFIINYGLAAAVGQVHIGQPTRLTISWSI